MIKKLHYFTGLTITVFVALHLFNHLISIWGIDKHIELMASLRLFYRNLFVEIILLTAVVIQIVSGLKLFFVSRKEAVSTMDKLHVWSGLYLAFFLVIHVSAVLVGRFILHLDTNFYFGAAGINSFPVNLFFIPYYVLAIISFFGHIAAIHAKKMKRKVLKVSPERQAYIILIVGITLTFCVFYGVTDHFNGITLPKEYNILVGR